jgi:NAD(P)-dependent dehydrogenase (short-subunit alcohol dehydrogenase family)
LTNALLRLILGEIKHIHMKWTASDIPDLTGKIAMVTGANSGLGFHTCLELARKGAHVVLVARNKEKGNAAMEKIRSEIPSADLQFMKIDLANLELVKHFAYAFKEEYEKLDIMVNNAGVMAIPLLRTVQGFEMQFGTNHLGHFALTALMFDFIENTPGSRIVNVSSLMHKFGKFNFEDLNWEKSYSKWAAYSQSKLSNLLFTLELDKRLRALGKQTKVMASHPGYASTNLQTRGGEMEGSKANVAVNNLMNKIIAQPAWQGALPSLYAATSNKAESGKFYGPSGFGAVRGYPKEEMVNPKFKDPEIMKRLWEESEKLTGIKFIL